MHDLEHRAKRFTGSLSKAPPSDRPGRVVTLNVVKKGDGWTYQMVDRQYDADTLPSRTSTASASEGSSDGWRGGSAPSS